MIVNEEKEVYFKLYCGKCKHKDKPEIEDPCHECLSNPTNLYSHKPTNFEEDDK